MTDVESPAVIRHVSLLRDMGLSWAKIIGALDRRFEIKTTQAHVKKVYKDYSDKRKELIATSPEFQNRLQRDMEYALERMDYVDKEVEELLITIKDKAVLRDEDKKLLLQCIDRLVNIQEKKLTMLKGLQPKVKQLAGPTHLSLTQNIVSSIDELKRKGLIKNIIDVEVIENAETDTEDRGERGDQGSYPLGDGPEGVPGDEDRSGQGTEGTGQEDSGVDGSAEPSSEGGVYTSAPIVTLSATRVGDFKPPVKDTGPTKGTRRKTKDED